MFHSAPWNSLVGTLLTRFYLEDVTTLSHNVASDIPLSVLNNLDSEVAGGDVVSMTQVVGVK